MKHSNATLALALAAAFPVQPEAWAEDDERQLDSVVITATKTAKVASEAPATVTVVTAPEIADKAVNRLDEALVGAPGVFIRALGAEQPSNWQNQITLRGIPGYYRTGVLVDGVPINNAFSGGVNMSIVPIDDIEQIEVVPGPFSSLYGGAGMAGVVNVITKRPQGRELLAKAEGGSHNFRSVDLGYRDKLAGAVGVSLSYGHKQSDGYAAERVTKTPTGAGGTVVTGWQQTSTNTGSNTYIVGDRGPEAWDQDNYGAKLFLDLSADSRLTLAASYLTHATRDGQGSTYLNDGSGAFSSGLASIDGKSTTVNATDFLKATNGEDVARYSAAYETRLASDVKLKANLSYQDNQYWYTSITSNATNTSGPGSVADIPAKMLNGDLQLGFPVGDRHFLVVGASAEDAKLNKKVYALANWRDEDNRGSVGDWADGNATTLAAYVQDEMAVSDRLTVYLGARYDRWSTDGAIYINGGLTRYDSRTSSAFNPKASAVYRLDPDTVVKGAIGKAFRAPNLSDMYSTFGTSTIYWSNPDLKPEKVTTGEVGIEHTFKSGTLVRATLYRSNLTDLIYTETSGVNRYKRNAGAGKAEGIDLEVRQRLGRGLSAFVNATLVDTTITENTLRPASVGKQIPLQPDRIANLGLEGNYGAWSGSLIGSYVSKMYNTDDNSDVVNGVPNSYDPYFVVRAKLGYRISKPLTATLAVNNLFDRDYYQGTSKADGCSVYLGLEGRF